MRDRPDRPMNIVDSTVSSGESDIFTLHRINFRPPIELNFLMNSIDFLNTGTASEFVDALRVEVLQHPAVNHQFLYRLRHGLFPDMVAVLRDYAHQYSFYSRGFVKYLQSVIDNLPTQEQKDTLLENLIEEQGNLESSDLAERPHVEIFDHFKGLVGADDAYAAQRPPSATVEIWARLFDEKCQSNQVGIGLGAIGLATENIVPVFYPCFAEAIDKFTELGSDASLFFRLHVDCDDGHGEDLVEITKEIAEEPRNREAIRFGTISALNLRSAFWDSQLARSQQLV